MPSSHAWALSVIVGLAAEVHALVLFLTHIVCIMLLSSFTCICDGAVQVTGPVMVVTGLFASAHANSLFILTVELIRLDGMTHFMVRSVKATNPEGRLRKQSSQTSSRLEI